MLDAGNVMAHKNLNSEEDEVRRHKEEQEDGQVKPVVQVSRVGDMD